jgi:ribokinase
VSGGQLDPSAVDRFAGVEVVVVGSTMVDQIAYCHRVPAEGETQRAHRYVQGFGGKGANQAVMAARLGANVAFIGCVGDDGIGSATIDNLAGSGVDTSGVIVIAGAPTGVAPIWVDDRGANRILIAPGANEALDPPKVLAALGSRARPPDVVLAQLETPQAATAAAFAWATANGARTVLNPAPAASIDAAVLAAADWLIPNESEFLALFGVAADLISVADAAGRGGHQMVVTLGADGAILSDGTASTHVAARPVDVADTTGAGDAFAGAFSVGLAAGLSAADAVRLGCAAGALSVAAAGTQTSFPALDAVLRVFDRDTTGSADGDSAQLLP